MQDGADTALDYNHTLVYILYRKFYNQFFSYFGEACSFSEINGYDEKMGREERDYWEEKRSEEQFIIIKGFF